MALDPDIPASRQRVVFEAKSGSRALQWRLNGESLGQASGRLLWPASPGRHTLALLDADGRQWDALTFEVRGAAALAAP